MYLVLIETSGNQSYIFSTNKLKENIGASELTYQAGTFWVLEAIADITNRVKPIYTSKFPNDLRNYLLNPDLNLRIEDENSKVEVIVATSGKALLIVKEKADAKKIIETVTRKALQEAPGLDVSGVFISFNWDQDSLGKVNSNVHKHYEQARSKNLNRSTRFSRLPIADSCQTSGFPASVVQKTRGENIHYSKMAASKNEYAPKGIRRLITLSDEDDDQVLTKINQLERRSEESWLAVIHADGNGLGEIFLKFDQHIGATNPRDNRDYINKLRNFSIALDLCTENAFNAALLELPGNPKPIVPLIVGGDDLTVVCDGKYALKFTHTFLTEFEAETQKLQEDVGRILAEVAEQALGVGRLSACAGVAMIKTHFPFSVAYDLAEDLMQVAKSVKRKVTHPENANKPYPCSALDFHVVYDSSDVELKRIREKLEIEVNHVKSVLYHRPFVTTEVENLHMTTGKNWAELHHWEKLENQVKAVEHKNKEGRRIFPNSQIHALRTGLFQGKQKSDAQYQLIRPRYLSKNTDEPGIDVFEGEPGSLFFQDQFADTQQTYVTALVDVIDASGFL